MIEVEMKIHLSEKEFLRTKRKLDLISTDKTEKIIDDLYFQHPCRNFKETDEALRIRKSNNVILITYKGPKIGKEMKTREEFEFKIEDFEMAKITLERLGFVPVAHVKKKRTSYKWMDYTISLGKVEELGTFLEIECEATREEEVEKKEKKIKLFLVNKLEIKKIKSIRKSYLELLLEKKRS